MADQGTEGLLSPFLRRQRFNSAQSYLKGNILDVGCGTGMLAEFIPSDRYLGVDIDKFSLQKARKNFPKHKFVENLPETAGQFDTVVALAVIEHIKDPASFLTMLAQHLKPDPSACIIITTPHPYFDWVHQIGAWMGLFSKHASEEHESLLNLSSLKEISGMTGLKLTSFKRFLLGANQLAVLSR